MGWLEDLIGTSPDDNSGFENWLAPTDLFQPSQFISDLQNTSDMPISQVGNILQQGSHAIQKEVYPYLHRANPLEFIPRAARAITVETPENASISEPVRDFTRPIADIPAQMLSDPSQAAILPLFLNPVTGALAGSYFLKQMAEAGGTELGKGLAAQDNGENPWSHFGAGFGQLGMAGLAGLGAVHQGVEALDPIVNTESSPAQFDSSRELPVEAPNPKIPDPLVNKVDAPGILGNQVGNVENPFNLPPKEEVAAMSPEERDADLIKSVKAMIPPPPLMEDFIASPEYKRALIIHNDMGSYGRLVNSQDAPGYTPVPYTTDLKDFVSSLKEKYGKNWEAKMSKEEYAKRDQLVLERVLDERPGAPTGKPGEKYDFSIDKNEPMKIPEENLQYIDPVEGTVNRAAELVGMPNEKFGGYLPDAALAHARRVGNIDEGKIYLSGKKFGDAAALQPMPIRSAAEAMDKLDAIAHELAHKNAPGHGDDFELELRRVNKILDANRGELVQKLMGRDTGPVFKNEDLPKLDRFKPEYEEMTAPIPGKPNLNAGRQRPRSLREVQMERGIIPPDKTFIAKQKSQGMLGNQEGSVVNPLNPPPTKIPVKVANKIGNGPEYLQTVSKTERALLPGEKVIERMNPNIAAAEKRFRNQRETSGSEAFTVIEKAGRAADKISKNSQNNISKLFDGQNIVLSPQEMQIAQDMASELSLRGVKPQDIKAEFNRRGKADFGGIKQTLFDATEKSAEQAHLGDIKVRTIGNDRNARQSMKYYQDYMRQIKGRPPAEGALGEVTGKLRQLSALGDLRKSAITQISQFSQTAGTIGLRRAMRAIPETFGKGKYEVAELKAMADGSLWPNIAHETSRAMEAKDYMHGVNTVDKMMRVHANVAARMLADDAIKGNKYALKMADEVGLKPTDPNFINRVAKELTDKTQFRTDAPHMPLWTKTVGGKLATQYMSFAYQHSRYLADLGKHPIKNFGQIARLAAVGVGVGEAIGSTKAVLDSTIPGKNDEDTLIKRAIAGLAGDPNFDTKSTVEKLRAVTQNKRIPITSPAWRAMQNLANIGGAGVFQTVLERAFDPHKDLAEKVVGTVGGAVGTHLYDAGKAAIKDVQKYNKTGEANPRNLERFAIQHAPVKVPLVNFYKLGDYVLPPDVYRKKYGTRKVKF